MFAFMYMWGQVSMFVSVMCVCWSMGYFGGEERELGGGGLLLSWMFEHDCLDTCCFGYLLLLSFGAHDLDDDHSGT